MCKSNFCALSNDGNVLIPGTMRAPAISPDYDLNYSDWTGLIDLMYYGSPQGHGLFGLREDGTILCSYPVIKGEVDSTYPRFEEPPNHVVAIDSSEFLFVCLKEDGTVLVAGSEANSTTEFREKVRNLRNVAQVVATTASIAVRFTDGTVEVIDCYGERYSDKNEHEEVARWRGIKEIYTNRFELFALDNDGHVHYPGYAYNDFFNKETIEGWEDIERVKVYGDYFNRGYILAWKPDGTLLTNGIWDELMF